MQLQNQSPTPAPVLIERVDRGGSLTLLVGQATRVSSISSTGTDAYPSHTVYDRAEVWKHVTEAAGSVVTFVTDPFVCSRVQDRYTHVGVGGEGVTFITAIGGLMYELATSGREERSTTPKSSRKQDCRGSPVSRIESLGITTFRADGLIE
jgi:hypothetical protein